MSNNFVVHAFRDVDMTRMEYYGFQIIPADDEDDAVHVAKDNIQAWHDGLWNVTAGGTHNPEMVTQTAVVELADGHDEKSLRDWLLGQVKDCFLEAFPGCYIKAIRTDVTRFE